MKQHPQQSVQHNKQFGMSLIEIMIGITISLLLLGGLIELVMANKQTYKVQDAMARVQENGRFSLHFLSKDVRMAGFMGCSNTNGGLKVSNKVDPNKFDNPDDVRAAIDAFTGTSAVVGYSYIDEGSTPTAVKTELSALGLTYGSNEGDIVENTDVLFIRRAASCPGNGITSSKTGTAQLFMDNSSCGIKKNDVVMVSNCESAEVFGVTNNTTSGGTDNVAHAANLNVSSKLTDGYGADSYIFKMKSDIYYIGVGRSGQPALFKRDLSIGVLTSNELVEGVEDMLILYGEDRTGDGSADIYVVAASVTDMENVVSLRITATIRTIEDNIATTSNGTDKRIRRNFTTTIGIRNRIS